MKATTYIIAAVLSLQVSLLFAGNNEMKRGINYESPNPVLISLAPTTPSEAGFSDIVPETGSNLSNLAPVTPAEADFNDMVPETKGNLAPVTPLEADFNESEVTDQINISTLAPVTPAEADFEQN